MARKFMNTSKEPKLEAFGAKYANTTPAMAGMPSIPSSTNVKMSGQIAEGGTSAGLGKIKGTKSMLPVQVQNPIGSKWNGYPFNGNHSGF